jgi:HSP20 family protein
MNIIPWKNKRGDESLTPVTQFRSEFDRLFDRFFSDPWSPFGAGNDWPMPGGGFVPTLDLRETESDVIVRVEVPGMKADDIDIQVTGDVMTISGEKKEESEHSQGSIYHAERRFGRFRRSIQLPGQIEIDRVTADYDQGVLTVHLPRSEAVKPKHIDVKVGD